MRRLAAFVVVIVVGIAAGACGDAKDKALSNAQEGLGAVKRGDLKLTFTGGAGQGDGGGVGFSLAGPFDLTGQAGEVPKAELTFTRVGGKSQPVQFTSDGRRAYVKANGTSTELTGPQLDRLRLTKGDNDEGVAGLHLDEWAEGESTQRGDRIEADVDPVKALNDVFTLAGQFGESVGPVEGEAAERLRKAVTSSRVVVLQGKDDVVRRLTLDIAFAANAAESVKEALGDYSAAWLRLDLELTPR